MTIISRSEPKYAVRGVIFWGSNTVCSVTQAQALQNYTLSMIRIRQWYYDNCDGYTFKALAPFLYTSTQTERQLWDGSPGFFASMRIMDAQGYDMRTPGRFYMFVCPMLFKGLGGNYMCSGLAENPHYNFMGTAVIGTLAGRRVCGDFADFIVKTGPTNPTVGTSLTLQSDHGRRAEHSLSDSFVPRNFRVYAAGANPLNAGTYEIVRLETSTANSDVITITRNQGGVSRAIQSGDYFTIDGDPMNASSDCGGVAHELGHGFGTKFFNASQYPSLTGTEYGVGNWGRLIRVDDNNSSSQLIGSYEACPHTGNSPIDPDLDKVHRLMNYDFRSFPVCNLTAVEKARFIANPYLAFQSSRPTELGD